VFEPIDGQTKQGKIGQRAVISGIDVKFAELVVRSKGKKIGGRDVCIKEVAKNILNE